MKRGELQNELIENVVLMVRKCRCEEFSTSNSALEKSFRNRQQFILNLLLLNNGLRFEDMLLPYSLYDAGGDNDRKIATSMNALYKEGRLKNAIRSMMNSAGKQPFIKKEIKAYKRVADVYSITLAGVKMLAFLDDVLAVPDGYIRHSEADLHELYDQIKNKKTYNHGIDSTSALLNTIFNSNYYSIKPVLKEVARNINYYPEYVIRGDATAGMFIPDVSFGYQSKNRYGNNNRMPVQPVACEIDLNTEHVAGGKTPFANKIKEVIGYSDRSRNDLSGTLPFSLIVVSNLNTDEYSKFAREGKRESVKLICFPGSSFADVVLSNRFKDKVEHVILGITASSAGEKKRDELETMDLRRLVDLADDYDCFDNDYDEEILSEIEEMVSNFWRFVDFYGGEIANELTDEHKLTYRDIGLIRKCATIDSEVVSKSLLDERTAANARIKAAAISEYLRKEYPEVRREFLFGFSLAVVENTKYVWALKTLHPYGFGRAEIKGLARRLGIAGKDADYSLFYPCFPLFVNDHDKNRVGYFHTLRNCFVFGDIKIFVEDVGFDIAALPRVQDYIYLPSGYIKNTLLVAVVNDDFTVADGRSIEHIFMTLGVGGDKYEGFEPSLDRDEYAASWEKAYGRSDRVPLDYRNRPDVVFVTRKEYLNFRKETITGYIWIKSRRIERTVERNGDSGASFSFEHMDKAYNARPTNHFRSFMLADE